MLGQLNGIYAAALAELWELFEEIYQSAYPDTASGQSLSYIAALSGTLRQEATKAELDVTFAGTIGTDIPAGTMLYPDGDPDSLFQTTTLATVTAFGLIDVIARAITEGSATTATFGDDLVIATPVPGITDVYLSGTSAFSAGLDEETDNQLRDRREQTLARAGASTVEAIRADMLGVTGVDSCTVFENPSGQTDPNGVPANAIEVLIFNSSAPTPDPLDIVNQIWLSKPAGTETHGALNAVATDSQGEAHTINYSEPTTVTGYVAVTLTQTSDGAYPGDTDVKQAIEDWGNKTLEVGQGLYSSDIVNVVADITGVESVDVTATYVDDDATPAPNTSLVAAVRELIVLAVARVTVTS